MVGYHYDANSIIGIPVKNRTAAVLTDAWQQLHCIFSKAGVAPDMWVMDNEISDDLIKAMENNNTTYQLVTPYSHCRNLAERAIQSYKNHFKSGMASVDPNFPLSEWDCLIEQANITINLLRTARVNPALSAYAFIFGTFNFSATPLAPPGTKVVAYIDPKARGTWDLNGETGWYVGPAMKHYRNVNIYIPRTRAIRTCDTVTFFPSNIPFPKVNLRDYLVQAAEDIITILNAPPSTTTPTLEAGDEVRNALLNIAKMLQRAEKLPLPPEIPTPTTTVTPPRVGVVQPPRVQDDQTNLPLPPSTMKSLQQHSNKAKNQRYQQIKNHKYNL